MVICSAMMANPVQDCFVGLRWIKRVYLSIEANPFLFMHSNSLLGQIKPPVDAFG